MSKEKLYVNSPKEINGVRVVQEDLGILEALKKGETVLHWEAGDSMYPILFKIIQYLYTKMLKLCTKNGIMKPVKISH